jgi:iron complex outermembrane receptor protein
VPIDPISTRSIEVVRGAGTLRYGSQAIGGVVNAINNRIPLTLPDKPSGEVQAAYDSVSDAGQGAALGDVGLGKFAVHADGFYRHTDNYDTPLGEQANSFFRGDGFSLGSSYFFGGDNSSRVGAAVVHYDSKYGVPSDVTFINMRQTKYLLGSALDLGGDLFKALNIDASYGNYSHEEIDPTNNKRNQRHLQEQGIRRPCRGAARYNWPIEQFGGRHRNTEPAILALGDAANYLLPTVTQNYAGFFFSELPPVTGCTCKSAAGPKRFKSTAHPLPGFIRRVASRQSVAPSASCSICRMWSSWASQGPARPAPPPRPNCSRAVPMTVPRRSRPAIPT